MADVVLKNDFFAGGQRFRKDPHGRAVSIPQSIIEAHGLPKSARRVGADYKPPAPPKDDRTHVDVAAAEDEQRVLQEVEETLEARKPEPQRRRKKPTDEAGQSMDEVIASLPDMDETALRKLLEDERAGKGRPSLLVQIEAAIEDVSSR